MQMGFMGTLLKGKVRVEGSFEAWGMGFKEEEKPAMGGWVTFSQLWPLWLWKLSLRPTWSVFRERHVSVLGTAGMEQARLSTVAFKWT